MTLELQTGYIADAILEVKKKKFYDNYVTLEELVIIEKILELRIKNQNLKVKFHEGFFENYFIVENGIITKLKEKENETLKSYISDDNIRKLIYNDNFIYWCLVQITINKLYASVEHKCDDCIRPCHPTEEIEKHQENGCCNFKYNFTQNCIYNIEREERILIDDIQKERIRVACNKNN